MVSSHEKSYRHTVEGALAGIEAGNFTDNMIPQILTGLKSELAQCLDLGLISDGFYQEQMGKIQSKSTELEEG